LNNLKILIPARGGSKRIPNKNLVDCNGKPLIHFTLKESLASNLTNEIFVSTDSREIIEFCINYPIKFIKRPANISTDESTTDEAIAHFVEKECRKEDFIILLQPTSPLRSSKDIISAFELFQNRKQTVISMVRPIFHPAKSVILENGECKPWSNYKFSVRSQDLPDILSLNGAIYVFSVKDFLENNSIPKRFIPYITPFERSIDIDNLEELNLVKKLMDKVDL